MCLQVEWVALWARDAWGPFIAAKRNLPIRGVRDPDMSRLGGRICLTTRSGTRLGHRTCPMSGLNLGFGW
jgi:hypothetical protein